MLAHPALVRWNAITKNIDPSEMPSTDSAPTCTTDSACFVVTIPANAATTATSSPTTPAPISGSASEPEPGSIVMFSARSSFARSTP